MDKKLHVLILEDLLSDAELAKRELKTVLNNFDTMVIDTENAYVQAIETFKPDLIISDYSMPTFDGMSALKIRNKTIPETPFVMLTGSVNEETAVKCIMAGADDYVIKEHVRRLGSAVLGAVEKKKLERETKQKEKELIKLKTAVEQTPLSIVITDINGNIEYVNPIFEKLTGYSIKEAIGQNPRILKSGKTTESEYKALWDTINKGNTWNGEFLNKMKNGELYWESATISPVKDNSGKITNYLAIKEDITERKALIQELMDREEKYRTLTYNLNVGIYRSTPGINGKFIEANPAFLKIFDFRNKSDLDYYKVVDFFSEKETREKFESKLTSIGYLINEEMQLKKKDGTFFYASLSVTAARDKDNNVIHYDGIVEDITERKQIQDEILKQQSELKTLTNQMINTEEKAKRDLAISLHDNLSQSIVVAKMKINELDKSINNAEQKKLISDILSNIENAINESRNITYELSPPVLYELGLVSAIQWKLDEVEKFNKIKTTMLDNSNKYQLEENVQIVLYRTIAELVQNVIKHAKAKNITVSFRLLKDNYMIIVSDNGVGFNVEEMKKKAIQQKKFGIFSIEERVKYIGGSLNIESKPQRGTKVIIDIPVAG